MLLMYRKPAIRLTVQMMHYGFSQLYINIFQKPETLLFLMKWFLLPTKMKLLYMNIWNVRLLSLLITLDLMECPPDFMQTGMTVSVWVQTENLLLLLYSSIMQWQSWKSLPNIKKIQNMYSILKKLRKHLAKKFRNCAGITTASYVVIQNQEKESVKLLLLKQICGWILRAGQLSVVLLPRNRETQH